MYRGRESGGGRGGKVTRTSRVWSKINSGRLLFTQPVKQWNQTEGTKRKECGGGDKRCVRGRRGGRRKGGGTKRKTDRRREEDGYGGYKDR